MAEKDKTVRELKIIDTPRTDMHTSKHIPRQIFASDVVKVSTNQ